MEEIKVNRPVEEVNNVTSTTGAVEIISSDLFVE